MPSHTCHMVAGAFLEDRCFYKFAVSPLRPGSRVALGSGVTEGVFAAVVHLSVSSWFLGPFGTVSRSFFFSAESRGFSACF